MTSLDIAQHIVDLSKAPHNTLYIISGWVPVPILQIDLPHQDARSLRVTVRSTSPNAALDPGARARLEARGFADVARLEPVSRVLEVERSLDGAEKFAAAAARWWLHYDSLAPIWREHVPRSGRPMALVTSDAVSIDAGHIGVSRDLITGCRCLHRRTLVANAFMGRLGAAPEILKHVQGAAAEALRSLLEMAVLWQGDEDNT